MVLKFIYTLFIGILFATLVGVGIAAFYPEPKMPDFPSHLQVSKPIDRQTDKEFEQQQQEQKKYDEAIKKYQGEQNIYSRNVSIIALIAAVIGLIVSLTLLRNLLLIADGLLLGGLLTLVYSIIRGFGTDDNMFRFIVVAVGFITATVIGYIKFVRPAEKKAKK